MSASRPVRRARRVVRVANFARFDADRFARTGVPEVVLAEGKRPSQLVEILATLSREGRGALVSRLGPAHRAALEHARGKGLPMRWLAGGRLGRLEGRLEGPRLRGRVAILTAGTADVAHAEEARELLAWLGVTVFAAYDVGVAGLHRLGRALRTIERHRPSVYVVLAGREGTLPTIVAGLVRAPVIGVPTSNGYGRGGRGEAALNTMLQSCAPVAVVNIDGTVPAALLAAQILAGAERLPPPRRPVRSGRTGRAASDDTTRRIRARKLDGGATNT